MPKYRDRIIAPKFIGDGSELTVKDLKLSEIIKILNLMVPIGTIMAFGGSVHVSDLETEEQDRGSAKVQNIRACLAEQGWLVCDGSDAKIEDYSELYSTIGCAFGGDKKTYFNLQDLRGRFLRGVDHGAGQDPDAENRFHCADGGNKSDSVGSFQNDEFKAHKHVLEPGGDRSLWPGKTLAHQVGPDSTYKGEKEMITNTAGGTETRPKNINVNWIIKSKNIIGIKSG
jgi:microcystin-dependent protein